MKRSPDKILVRAPAYSDRTAATSCLQVCISYPFEKMPDLKSDPKAEIRAFFERLMAKASGENIKFDIVNIKRSENKISFDVVASRSSYSILREISQNKKSEIAELFSHKEIVDITTDMKQNAQITKEVKSNASWTKYCDARLQQTYQEKDGI